MSKALFIRTRVIQMDILPGQPQHNAVRIISNISRARKDGIQLLVFPEMSVPGYFVGDNWERPAFLNECYRCNEEIRKASKGLIVVFGSLGMDPDRRNEDGRVRKYNALYVAENGEFRSPSTLPYSFAVKSLLPDYREFEETRHFYDLRKLAMEENRALEDLVAPIETSLASLGCILCEDAWDIDYNFSPLEILAQKNADLFLSVSASPFTLHKRHKRTRVFCERTKNLGRPLIYANCTGIQNNGKCVFTFDGDSAIYDGLGNCIKTEEPFTETEITHEIPLDQSAFGRPCRPVRDNTADIYRAINFGTSRFMDQCGLDRIVVGISGGIDSAVVAAVYGKILPPDRLLLANMPSCHNSSRTRNLAKKLAGNIGCLYTEIPIDNSCKLTQKQMDGLVLKNTEGTFIHKISLSSRVMENVQARDRSARILAALAAAFGGAFTCNANKSEATVGYTTLYGDLAGYFANLADLWKGEVYDLARYLNAEVYGSAVVPPGSIDLIPSAELSSSQDVDSNQGDPLCYPYHDCLFRSWIEWWNRTTPEEILEWYADGILEDKIGYTGKVEDLFHGVDEFIEDLEKWWNAYEGLGLAKRIQAPPVLAIKKRAFGFDLRESQLPSFYSSRYRELKKTLHS